MTRALCTAGVLCFLGAFAATTWAGEHELDRLIAEAHQPEGGGALQPMPVVDDAVFLRRVYVDLIGRIPTADEVREFGTWPAGDRRSKLIDQLLQDERFADRWTIFYSDMLRLRSQAAGGAALIAYVHEAVKNGMPYDEMCRRLIYSNGKAGKVPEAGFILGDDADPLAMASITSQVFLGVRIGCAQCHDHPFDVWTRRDFYDLAAFFGKTRRFESQLTRVIYATETSLTSILWPPEGAPGSDARKPLEPRFPFPGTTGDAVPEFVKRREALRAARESALAAADTGPTLDDLLDSSSEKVAKATTGELIKEQATAEAKSEIRKIDVQKGLYQPSELREQLAVAVTDPRNLYFSRALVNRVWKTLVGRGFVEPVDDFRQDNAAALPAALDYLSEEFVASDYDLRSLVRLIVNSEAYQRGHAPADSSEAVRVEMETNLLATPVRRMQSEALYDSIVTAGHLFEPKHSPGRNVKIIRTTVLVPVKAGDEGTAIRPNDLAKGKGAAMPAMARGAGGDPAEGAGYALEAAIELDFTALLKDQGDDEVEIDEMRAMSQEELEAQRMMQMRMARNSLNYEEQVLERQVDDNPVFSTAMRMQSPAPEGHFLRVFGQPNRSDLGDLRDDAASMRQALMMLNGRVTHEASRVGDLEPVHALLVGRSVNLDEAIRLVYLEIFTRAPSKEELADAKEILNSSPNPTDGMADLRWILLNCNEFRFLP
ncbi:MAG: DUF1553 domain-containing protein [Planctomycetota bacterium]|nr:DUF1553 domain-containing protein [Planctomycetota bacterium]